MAVAGHPTEPSTFYFGACAGGVWKTTDGGVYWEPISDGFFETAAVGAIAVAPSAPNVIYVGTGEACIRGNVSHGDGVYRSDDGGARGGTSASAIAATSGGSAWTRETPTPCTWRRWGTLGARTASAASSAPATAAPAGTTCSSGASGRGPLTSRWIRTTRACCSRRCGRPSVCRGR